MEYLPSIAAVLISYNHFDHLDLPTLRQLATRGDSTFVVAARRARLLRSQRIESVHELDGESLTISGVTIHYVPALHFSARGILDRNKTLWWGYGCAGAPGVLTKVRHWHIHHNFVSNDNAWLLA